MKKYLLLVIFTFPTLLYTGCGWQNISPRKTWSKTDVASSKDGGPSAEISISIFQITLADEAIGKPCPSAWVSYRNYWLGRMDYIMKHENEEYYNRVFRDFEETREHLKLSKISVKPYQKQRQPKKST